MVVRCCKCKKEYGLEDNIFEYKKDTNCPILICPHCGFKHAISFMPFDNKIEDFKKVEKLDLAYYVILGASRIADASRVDQSTVDDFDVKDGVAWDVSTFKYANKSKLVSDQETSPQGLTFSSDGTKMYIIGYASDTVYQYTLSPAWDVSTATYADKSKLVSDQEIWPQGVTFSSDGTKMYIVGDNSDTVWQYTLSSAWDVSTATYADKSKLVSDQGETSPRGVTFSSDGYKMYIIGVIYDAVLQYTLSSAWDVSTAIYAEKYILIGDQEVSPQGVVFNSDGTKMYIIGYASDTVWQYTLSSAWDVSTATYAEKSKLISGQDLWPYDVAFSPDGTKMYIVGYDSSTVWQYTLSSAWTKTDDFILATRIYTPKGPLAKAHKLRWRDVTDEGVFADVTDTGEITYSAVTDLTDGGTCSSGEAICSIQTDYTWQDGLENEEDNLLPDTGTYSLADEYYTELQWALDCDGAEDEHEYEFELWDITEGASVGTCLASITMGITVIGPTEQAVSGVLTLAGGTIKGTSSIMSGALTFVGDISNKLKKVLAGGLILAGSVVNKVATGLSGVLTSTGTLTNKTKASISGTLTFIGTIAKGLSERLAGVLTFVGTISNLPKKTLLGVLSSVGSLTNKGKKLLAGVVSPVGSITKTITAGLVGVLTFVSSLTSALTNYISLTGILTLAGKVTKKTKMTTEGVLSFVGFLTKGLFEGLVGVLTFVGSLETLKTILKSLAGTLTFVGEVSNLPKKVLSASLTLTGDISKKINKGLTGALTFIGTLTKLFTQYISLTGVVNFVGTVSNVSKKVLVASLTFVGDLTNKISIGLAGVLTLIGTILGKTSKNLKATLTFISSLTNKIVKGLTGILSFVGSLVSLLTNYISLSGTLNIAGALSRFPKKVLSADLAFIGQLTNKAVKGLAGLLTLTGSVISSLVNYLSISGALTFVSTVSRLPKKSLIGVLTSIGTLTKKGKISLVGALSFTGPLLNKIRISFLGTLTFVGTVARVKIIYSILAGTLPFAGAITRKTQKVLVGSISFAGVITKSISKLLSGVVDFIGSIAEIIRRLFRQADISIAVNQSELSIKG